MTSAVIRHRVESLDLFGCEHPSPLDLHLGLPVHKFQGQGIYLLLLGEDRCLIGLGISEKLAHFESLLCETILQVTGIRTETVSDLTQRSFLLF